MRKLTKKQKGFAQDYLETGNGSLSARNNYDVSTDESARAIASQNLTKPNIQAYLESRAEKAAEIIFNIAENGENDSVRLSASKDILDRAGYKAVEKSITITKNYRLTDEEVQRKADILVEVQKNGTLKDTRDTGS